MFYENESHFHVCINNFTGRSGIMSSRSEKMSIRICPQGHVNLSLGHTTLHLDFVHFLSLLETGRQALEEYRERFSPVTLSAASTLPH